MDNDWEIEKIDVYRDYKYIIALNTVWGYRCGYVQIPENCTFYDMDLTDLEEKHDFVSNESFPNQNKYQNKPKEALRATYIGAIIKTLAIFLLSKLRLGLYSLIIGQILSIIITVLLSLKYFKRAMK